VERGITAEKKKDRRKRGRNETSCAGGLKIIQKREAKLTFDRDLLERENENFLETEVERGRVGSRVNYGKGFTPRKGGC